MLLVAISGFVVASVLCGLAQSLNQIVGFRLLQGLFGAALVPLSQGILLDIYNVEERGTGHGAVRRLGHGRPGARTGHRRLADRQHDLALGVLHQRADRRAGLRRHRRSIVTETKLDALAKLDCVRLRHAQSIAIAALQLFLDRGEQLDWFYSGEIIIEALGLRRRLLSLPGAYIHGGTQSFVNPRLFLDQNFAVSMLFIFIVGVTYLASLALMTPYLQTLMGYPVVTAGIVMGPRGLGTMVCMFIVGG